MIKKFLIILLILKSLTISEITHICDLNACECNQEFDLNYVTCNITSLEEEEHYSQTITFQIETLNINLINSSQISKNNGYYYLFENLDVNFLTIRNYIQLDYDSYYFDFLAKNIDLSNNNLQSFKFNIFSNQLKESIEYIQFNNNQLEKIPNLNGFIKLNELDFKLNKLKDINNIELLLSLEVLDLSFNILKIIDLSFESSVQKMSLANNLIEEIINLKFENLIYLEISFNKLMLINVTTFSSLENLIELYVSNNLIESIENASFYNLTKLTTLDLSYNQLRHLDSNLFKMNTKLEKFYVQNNDLKIFNLFYLNNVFIMDLSNNKLTSIEVIEEEETNYSNLNMLRLSNNNFSTLNNSLMKLLSKIQFLYLDNNYLNEIKYCDISTITKLDYSKQNGNLKLIPNYFFRKLKTNQILLTLNLSINLNLKFENKSFCFMKNEENKVNERSFLDLYLSNVTLFNLNKCVLKQLSYIFKRTRLFLVDLNDLNELDSRNYFFCDCNYRIFLSYFNILIKSNCPRFSTYCLDKEFYDDCKGNQEFEC